MNPNMSICSRLNPRLLVQAEVGLDPLHWANMSNISPSPSLFLGLIVIVVIVYCSGYIILLLWGPIEPCVQTALEEARPNI